jgi:FAD/FMN-containing dehydrogenase
MNSILEINGVTLCFFFVPTPMLTGLFVEADGDLRCQPGAKWEDINNTLKDRGIPLFFPVRTPCHVL